MLAGYDNGDVKMFDLRTNKVNGGGAGSKGFRVELRGVGGGVRVRGV